MPVVKNKKAKVVKKTAKKMVAAKPAKAVVQLTAQQKKDFKMQLAVATQEAYFKGRYEEARDQEKSAAALEKVISAAVAQFDKKQQKLAKVASKKLDKQLAKLGIKPAAKAEKAAKPVKAKKGAKTAKVAKTPKVAKVAKAAPKAKAAVKTKAPKVAKTAKAKSKKVARKDNSVQSSVSVDMS